MPWIIESFGAPQPFPEIPVGTYVIFEATNTVGYYFKDRQTHVIYYDPIALVPSRAATEYHVSPMTRAAFPVILVWRN